MATPVVNELTTAQYSCDFVDETGATISDTAISAIAASLQHVATNTYVNSRITQDVLNANGGVLSSGGGFALTLGAADNIAITGVGTNQLRRLTLYVTYATGTLATEFNYIVRSLAGI